MGHICESLFSTLTNVNFDPRYFERMINRSKMMALDAKGEECRLGSDISMDSLDSDPDLRSLKELLLYGMKGIAAYYHHAMVLGHTDKEIEDFLIKGLIALRERKDADELVSIVLECGKTGITAMALLDKANTGRYGHPEVSEARIGVRGNPGILISGHDLRDLEELLEQTKGTGVDVYTHGEMLPANAYPFFKRYDHLAGNYGNAWHEQTRDFERFNGPVLMTTNCLVPPRPSYKERLFTTGPVGWYDGVKHIPAGTEGKKDFSEIVNMARTCKPPRPLEDGVLTIGFAHNAVLGIADTVVNAVRSGAIKRFVVMAGCDGRESDRSYYSEFASSLPDDAVILTAGCAKYRYNKMPLKGIGGIPRVLDAGQCNDCYSLVVIAQKLAEVFGCGVNDLPISFNISWYEQKACLVLLSLLYLGIKDIMLGPRLPEFISPNILDVLVGNFGIKGISTVDADKRILHIS